MRKLILVAVLLASCATARNDSPLGVVDAFLSGLENADPNIGRLFADDATVFLPMNDRPLRVTGRADITAAFAALFAMPGYRGGSIPRPATPAVQWLGQDAAVITFEIVNPNITSRRTFVVRREGGEWRIVHLHGSNVRASS